MSTDSVAIIQVPDCLFAAYHITQAAPNVRGEAHDQLLAVGLKTFVPLTGLATIFRRSFIVIIITTVIVITITAIMFIIFIMVIIIDWQVSTVGPGHPLLKTGVNQNLPCSEDPLAAPAGGCCYCYYCCCYCCYCYSYYFLAQKILCHRTNGNFNLG